MILTRTTVGIERAGDDLLTADCVRCGDRAAFLTPAHPRTAVDHRCGVGAIGSVWTLLEPPEVAVARRRRIRARRDAA